MSKVYILVADGFEEIEGLTVVDLLRRAKVDIKMVSIKDTKDILGSHNIELKTDLVINDIIGEDGADFADMLVLPGGVIGTNNLKKSNEVDQLIRKYNEAGKYLAAVCAAPTVYGENGLVGACPKTDSVVVDGQFITSRGLGTSIDFALKIIEVLISKDKAVEIGKQVVYLD